MSALKRLRGRTDGVTAVEYAMLAPVFLVVFGFAADLALILYANSMVDRTARMTAEQVRTLPAGAPTAGVESSLASDLGGSIACDSIDVAVTPLAALSEDISDGQAEMVRVTCDWPLIFPLSEYLFGTEPGAIRRIEAKAIFARGAGASGTVTGGLIW